MLVAEANQKFESKSQPPLAQVFGTITCVFPRLQVCDRL